MKKHIFICVLLWAQASWAQDFAPMKGIWYCPETLEMFVINTDAQNVVEGKGVFYAKGGNKMRLMQIMTQTAKKDATLTDVYFLKVYDPATPNMAYELTSYMDPMGVVIGVTATGSRDKVKRFNALRTEGFSTDEAYLKKITPADLLKEALSFMRFINEEDTAQEAPEKLTFSFLASSPTTTDSEVRYKGKTATVTVLNPSHTFSFTLAPYNKVSLQFMPAIGWRILFLNAQKKSVATFTQDLSE